MMNIIVTGGFGFVGSHVTEVLQRAGHAVIPCSRRNGVDLRDPQAAEPFWQECLDIRRQVFPPEDTEIDDTAMMLGQCRGALGRWDEAESLMIESAEHVAAVRGENAEQTRRAREKVVAFYEGWGMTEQAETWRMRLAVRQP